MNIYQEPKYDVRDGKLTNRQSNEAIPEDEPVFILRARDKHAHAVLVYYSSICVEPEHREAARIRAAQFANWSIMHPSRMKEPDSKMDTGWTSAGSCQPKDLLHRLNNPPPA